MNNPFRNRSKEEELKRAEERSKLNEQLSKAIANATHILSSEWGAKYVKDLTDTRDALIRYCIKTVNPDPVKDAFMIRAVLNKLAILYEILDNIQSDANGQ